MWEADDRLAGDPVWELFHVPARRKRSRNLWGWLLVAFGLLVLELRTYPVLAVLTVCVAAAWSDLVQGWRASRSIPDRTARLVSSRFSFGWAFWKLAVCAVVLF